MTSRLSDIYPRFGRRKVVRVDIRLLGRVTIARISGLRAATSGSREWDGVVVGYVAGVVKTGYGPGFKPEGERYLEIQELFVHPDHRRRRVGHQLVDAILNQATADGIQRSMVASGNVDWQATYRFYERHGFQMLSMEMYR